MFQNQLLNVAIALTAIMTAGSGTAAAKAFTDQSGKSAHDLRPAAAAPDPPSVSSHVIQIQGKTLRYKATAGRIAIQNDDEEIQAKMFYVAYVRNGAPASPRPVTFLFNGGPGSSSIYLHMGSFAPVRISAPKLGPGPQIEPGVSANPYTLLDVTDLVFIDMAGTGYSRLAPGVSPEKLWTVDRDAESFSRFIRGWLRTNGRELSPKFLLGESYGTVRASVLANRLQNDGMPLNGVMLTGAVLNFGLFGSGYDQSYISYLPTLAATAWYHRMAKAETTDLATFVSDARAFATGPYRQALAKGDAIAPEEAKRVADRLSELTGIGAEYILGARLRIEPENFRKELLRAKELVIGRFDSRFTAVDANAVSAVPDQDPSDRAVGPILKTSLQNYLRSDLHYEPDITYRFGIQDMPGFEFAFDHLTPVGDKQIVLNAAVDLAAAMTKNPNLKVTILSGYYDLATPFGAAEYDSSHMLLDEKRRRNLSMRYYPAGHMLYLDDNVLIALHHDLSAFITGAI